MAFEPVDQPIHRFDGLGLRGTVLRGPALQLTRAVVLGASVAVQADSQRVHTVDRRRHALQLGVDGPTLSHLKAGQTEGHEDPAFDERHDIKGPADQIADYTQCHLRLWVNDDRKQDTLVSDLIFNVQEIIEYLSRRMTLLPGEVIATGTPAGVGRPKGTFLKPGDRVRVEISGLGVLENPVVQGE